MAYPYEIGSLFPTEGAFKRPEGYREFLQAQATQRSSFLSSMDQFYEQLGESVRQFNDTLGFKETALAQEKELFGEELAWEREALTKQLAQQWDIHEDQMEFAGEELDFKRSASEREAAYRQGMLGLQGKELSAKSRYQSGMLDLEQDKLGLAKNKLALEQESQAAQLDYLRDSLEAKRGGYSEISSALEKLFSGQGEGTSPGTTSTEVTPLGIPESDRGTWDRSQGTSITTDRDFNFTGDQDTTDWWGYY